MRSLVILGTLATVLVINAPPSHANYEGPWCAVFWGGGDSSYENCSMRSYEMCINEIHGTGGNTLCSPNPRYQPSSIRSSEHDQPSSSRSSGHAEPSQR
jgi:uncharacterized protein DUF3551